MLAQDSKSSEAWLGKVLVAAVRELWGLNFFLLLRISP